MIHKNKAEKWGVNDDSPREKTEEQAYREGFIDGKKYIKDNVMSTVSNDAIASSCQTLRHHRENLIKWVEKL